MFGFAHRGGRGHGADNTIATFREALDRGAGGLETDAWLTADGVVVLDHDGVHRAADRAHKPIAEVRRDELAAHVPTLAQLYGECGASFDLAIDVREPATAAAVVEVARAHRATGRLWLVGAPGVVDESWRGLADDVRVVVSIRLVERRPQSIELARSVGAEALNMRWPWWTISFAERVGRAGLRTFAYDVQSRLSLWRCRSLQLDGVFSDHVSLLRFDR